MNVQSIKLYSNVGVPNAVVVIRHDHFGHGPIDSARLSQVDVRRLRLIHTAPKVIATPASFAPTARRGIQPAEAILKRPLFAVRPPHPTVRGHMAVPRLVPVPQPRDRALTPHRAPFGQSAIERPTADRGHPPSPPRFMRPERHEAGRAVPPAGTGLPSPPLRREPQVVGPGSAVRQPAVPRREALRGLPGEPASRLYSNGGERRPPQGVERNSSQPAVRPPWLPDNAAQGRPGR